METVGRLLIAGFVTFMVGAAGWKPDYDQAPESALPLIRADRTRWRWIHIWMIPAVILTIAALAGLATAVDVPSVTVAAAGYSMGAVLWILTLTSRLTVTEWAAERLATSGSVPDVFPPLAVWASAGHSVHMLSAYAASATLAVALGNEHLIAGWLAWAGVIFGVGLGALFLAPRTRWAAAPPFLAHVFTFAVGLALI